MLRRTIFHHPHPHNKEVQDELRNHLAKFDAEKAQGLSSKVTDSLQMQADRMCTDTCMQGGGGKAAAVTRTAFSTRGKKSAKAATSTKTNAREKARPQLVAQQFSIPRAFCVDIF
jgi:hypothetical protein